MRQKYTIRIKTKKQFYSYCRVCGCSWPETVDRDWWEQCWIQSWSSWNLLPAWSLYLYRVFYQDGSRGKLLPAWGLHLYRAFHVTLPKQVTKRKFCCLEGTASVISSDPPCKDGNARFTRVLFKALSDQLWIRTPCFCFRNCYFDLWFLCKSNLRISCF